MSRPFGGGCGGGIEANQKTCSRDFGFGLGKFAGSPRGFKLNSSHHNGVSRPLYGGFGDDGATRPLHDIFNDFCGGSGGHNSAVSEEQKKRTRLSRWV